MLKRMHILAGGRVQGVGFRGTCMQYALLYHLTGNVMNLESGDVEINVQGEEKEPHSSGPFKMRSAGYASTGLRLPK